MARKSLELLQGGQTPKSDKLVEFEAVSFVKYESAKDAYDAQDDETKASIDLIVKTIHTYVLPETKDGMEVSEDVVEQNVLALAMQVANDLALVDIKLANYIYPANLCASCGSDV